MEVAILIAILALFTYGVYAFFAYSSVTIPILALLILLRFLYVRYRDRRYTLTTNCIKCRGTGKYSTSLDEDSGEIEERLCTFCGGEGCEYCRNRGKVYEAGKSWRDVTLTCDYCKPSGVCYVRSDTVVCTHCSGRGKVAEKEKRKQDFGFKEVRVETPCVHCDATGRLRELYVKFPNGDRTMKTQSLTDPCNPKTRTRELGEYAGPFRLIREVFHGGFKEAHIWFDGH